ncbi:hypothetical protein FLGE108171_11755 [Flavobacterium gelidilacus]|uniref:hypothetical protein n=1 Tax=Flavobacterium gelidilacus TaxID=206041 RepID=UPI0004257E30|nr:hypothetical protein [Flavobacterium gelidilacus]
MKNQIPPLSPAFRELAAQHFVLLESANVAKKRDVLQLNLSGYSDVCFLIADIVKVCLLALEADGCSNRIPEPATNISGVLSLILDLLPYEEADLLDKIREAVLQPADVVEAEDDFMVENLFLTMPVGLMD